MLNDTTHLVKYSKHERIIDRYIYITNALVNILSTSPKSFVYILKLAFGNAFKLTIEDANRIVDGITEKVNPDVLSQCLKNVDDEAVLTLRKRPVISRAAMACLDDDGFELAVLLARHSYGDMNGTSNEQRVRSDAAIKNGRGDYVTCYILGDVNIKVTTKLPSYDSEIDIV